MNSERKILLAIVLVAMFLRVGGNIIRERVFFNKPFLFFGDAYEKSIISDSLWFDDAARSFIKGKGLLTQNRNRLRRDNYGFWVDFKKLGGGYYAHKAVPPLYPLFLSLCYYIGGTNTLSYFIPQLILSSLTCLFVYLLTKEIFNNERVAAIAGFAVAFYPDLIFFTNFIRAETLFIFLLALGFWAMVRGNSRGNIYLIFTSAVIFGLACLTRITLIFFIPILLVCQPLFLKKDKKVILGTTFLMAVIIVLVILPWPMRNFFTFGKFTPFSDEAYTFLVQRGAIKIAETEYYFRLNDSLVSRIIGFVKDRPKEFLLSSLRKLMIFYSPYTAGMKPLAKVYKGLSWLIIFPLAFWGMFVSRRNFKKAGLPIIFIFYHSLFHAASFADNGLIYRYPIQPFLCIFAGYGFWSIYRKLKVRGGSC